MAISWGSHSVFGVLKTLSHQSGVLQRSNGVQNYVQSPAPLYARCVITCHAAAIILNIHKDNAAAWHLHSALDMMRSWGPYGNPGHFQTWVAEGTL